MKRCSVRLAVLSIVLLSLAAFSVQAQQVFCVRAGATGSGNGSDWNNAYPSLPGNLQRGATYYIADGSYGTYTFNDPTSGSTPITIKKATLSDHGPAAGWQSGFGDGQAVFNSTLNFTTRYWVFDGSVRNESDWFDGGSYGFKVLHNNQGRNINVAASDFTVELSEPDSGSSACMS